MEIKAGMEWPPKDMLSYKMMEHSAWYSGEAEVLANFYNRIIAQNFLSLPVIHKAESFWSRQIRNQGEIFVHVPIAGDISETSANLLFSESPSIKVVQAHEESAAQGYKDTQSELDNMLLENGFFRKIIEGAETASAISGVYIKLAFDKDLSKYPIPVIVQADRAIPEFKFGILSAVTFWKVVDYSDNMDKVYRLLERYDANGISYSLYLGTQDRLGREVALSACTETADLVNVSSNIGQVLAVYIPNMLPNRLDRNSSLGRSDYQGIEGLMDSLDEIFSSWVKDIVVSGGKIHLPAAYTKVDSKGNRRYNPDEMVYVELDMDPLSVEGKNPITATQFQIRADQFEKTSLNFIERIVTAAGYSPQSFGLNIQGRAESGTALAIRERKSFATKSKKEQYWQPALKQIVHLMILVHNEFLGGTLEPDSQINVAFSDSITNDTTEVASAIKMVSDAMAASTETKVRMLHTDWDEDQIKKEVEAIKEENAAKTAPFENPDNFEME